MTESKQSQSLPDFLLARIAEDEAKVEFMRQEEARALGTSPLFDGPSMKALGGIDIFVSPDRWRAECDASRRIIELHRNYQVAMGEPDLAEECVICRNDDYWLGGDGLPEDYPCRTLRALALPYADHPDYRPEWRP
jgi:hypothetical protein